MSVHVPALPALVAGQALKADAMAAARRALEQNRRLLDGYEVIRAILEDVPQSAREAVWAALHRRFAAAGRAAESCRERLDEASAFCDAVHGAASPVESVPVAPTFFEMLSPYIEDAMAPVLSAISRRVGPGCTEADVGALFPRPGPSVAA